MVAFSAAAIPESGVKIVDPLYLTSRRPEAYRLVVREYVDSEILAGGSAQILIRLDVIMRTSLRQHSVIFNFRFP